MADKFTEVQVAEYKATFGLFDNGTGKVPSKELGTVMRALGENPTEAELKDMLSQVGDDVDGLIDFSHFLSFMAQRMTNNDSAEIIDAFRAFDREGNGYISAADLRHVITNVGDKMSEEEVDEFFNYADINAEGLIDYEAFVAAILK